MNAQWSRLSALASLDPEEQQLAGLVSGLLYGIGGLTLAAFLVLPGMPDLHPTAIVVLSAAAVAWAACGLWLARWSRVSRLVVHLSTALTFPVVAVAIWASGGASSPAWIYLLFIDVFAAYFYRRPIAIVYLIGCLLVHALPLLYDPAAHEDAFIGQMILSDGAYIGLAAAIISGRRLMFHLRRRAEVLATEQGSLRRVATAVVESEPEGRIYEVVATELARLIGAGAAGIMRLDGEDRAIVMGSWAEHEGTRYEPGTVVPIVPDGDVDRAINESRPVRIVGHDAESPVGRLGYDTSIVAPIRVAGETWGALAVTASAPKRLTREDEQHMMEFGDLLSTAIVNIEDRAKLAAQAATDPLTGLANHRTLQQRLSSEVARAIRHDTPLSVAVIDVDHFKQINDSGGHDAGDVMLQRVARCLEKLARAEDTLGRLGGDEFAWILPETSREQALVAVERVRRVIQRAAPAPYRLTVSAGICDTSSTVDPAELIRFADGALYWSKARGRDQCWIYDPNVVAELSARIVEGVLAPEQVEWIRTHHERPNGEGYPDGLTAEDIPEGAALLALADAWDVMTISRPYSRPKDLDEALRECCELPGVQFTPTAVAALLALHEAGKLGGETIGVGVRDTVDSVVPRSPAAVPAVDVRKRA